MARHSIAYGDERIEFSVAFMPRPQRRVAIHVTPDGAVRVDAPQGCEISGVKNAVRRRARWIWRQLQAQQDRQRHVLAREYVSGETHFYLGRRYILKVQVSKQASPGARLWRGRLEVVTPLRDPFEVRGLLNAWYRERAKDVFERVLNDMAQSAQPTRLPPAWRLLSMRTQWGSCSPKGDLLLNPHLVKAPRACIEYVIAHELCHLREHNHSPRFYRLLTLLLPDWAQRKEELDGLADSLLNQ